MGQPGRADAEKGKRYWFFFRKERLNRVAFFFSTTTTTATEANRDPFFFCSFRSTLQAFSTESEPPAGTTGLNPLLRAPGPLPPPSASAGADVVPLASSSSSSSPLPSSLQNAAAPPLLTAAQRQLRSRAVLKNIRISPKKLARFAKLVSGMHVEDALAQCSVARETKAAGLLRGVIASAAANARANHGSLRGGGNGGDGGNDGSNNFRVAEAVVGRAPTPTRPWYHGKGRTGVRHLYRSHLTVRKGRKKRRFFFFFFAVLLSRARSLFVFLLTLFFLSPFSFSPKTNQPTDRARGDVEAAADEVPETAAGEAREGAAEEGGHHDEEEGSGRGSCRSRSCCVREERRGGKVRWFFLSFYNLLAISVWRVQN